MKSTRRKRFRKTTLRQEAGKKKLHYFAMIPVEMVRDKKIGPGPCKLYALYHSFAQPKDLDKKPKTYVSQKRLAEELGRSVPTVSNWTQQLATHGWITVKRRGWKTSLVFLRARAIKVSSSTDKAKSSKFFKN